ncbi:MAG: sigma 54-interacting transcriptional regulator [Nitrospirae bacterium]|nr:sigma 54-interacting transcriptional regulator [Nitrospirota bacterium]
MSVAEVMAGQLEEFLTDECAALETMAVVLAGGGSPQQRVDHALELLQHRLRVLRARLVSSESGAEVFSKPPKRLGGADHSQAKEATAVTSRHAGLVGHSAAVQQVYQAIERVSHSQATVLLRGESGTGKELVAKAIHLEGPRADGPFIRLHCAAVTETLLESELFGHERGAFTGAVETRKGRFELADGGTLFLDEIGDVPLAIQVKLLRVLQDKCFERVGGSRLVMVDVRVISATHRDLEAMVRAGEFREDLYYRLNVVPIALPPLREREGDIPLLIEHFLARFNRENRRQVRLGHDLLALMGRYHWPGNVRELQNCVERLVVMADSDHDLVTFETIPPSLRGYFADMRQVTGADQGKGGKERAEGQPLGASLQAIERQRLLDALERVGWVQARAARALGLTPRQVAYKMRKYGICELK